MSEMTKIYPSKVAVFLNTATVEAPSWKRVGKGVTNLGLSYNPQTTTEQYIHENSATTSTDSYQVALDIPLTCYAGEPIFDYLDDIRQKRGIGSAAATEVLLVYLYDSVKIGDAITYKAERNAANIAINDFGSEAGKPVVMNATLSLNGDPQQGTVVITDGKPVFTAGETPEYLITFVVDDEDGTMLSGIQILINGKVLYTNANGIAEIMLPAGTYPYTAVADGYNNATGSINISTAGKLETVTMTEAT